MIPPAVIPEEDYLSAFRKYVFGLSLKWLGLRAESEQAEAVLDKIAEVARVNHRATYLNYLLPLADSRYKEHIPAAFPSAMHKVLYNMRLNGVPYNDFMLERFCDILLVAADKKGLFAAPLPEDYKDLQKLVWTFVQAFRKEAATRYSQDVEVI